MDENLHISLLLEDISLSEIGEGWHPAFADTFQENDLYYSEQRFLNDKREYWFQGFDLSDVIEADPRHLRVPG